MSTTLPRGLTLEEYGLFRSDWPRWLFLLHRFSDVDRQLHLEGWRERAGTLTELECRIWPL